MLDVLIVDDDPEARRLLREFLSPVSEHVFEAGNGRKALPLVEQHEFDLLIIDILMPDMDGLETIRILRSEGYRMPIIAMPTRGNMAERRYSEFAKSFGANDVLLKPFGQDDVLKAVRRTLDFGES